MIYTVTLNPSLDYILKVSNFELASTNRSYDEMLLPAGKGINVSLMLQNLGIKSKAFGFLAGFSGREIERLLEERKIITDFVFLEEGYSRINVKLMSDTESEINALGPEIGQRDLEQLFSKLDVLQEGDILVLSGSLPKNANQNLYAQIMERYCDRKIKVFLDCSGEALLRALHLKPFLIKPNQAEVEALFSLSNPSIEELKDHARKLQDLGAENIIISLGEHGAIFASECIAYVQAPKGEVKNSVGAGDSMVAGMIAGIQMGLHYEEAFLYALSCGSASAFSDGFAKLDQVESLFSVLREKR